MAEISESSEIQSSVEGTENILELAALLASVLGISDAAEGPTSTFAASINNVVSACAKTSDVEKYLKILKNIKKESEILNAPGENVRQENLDKIISRFNNVSNNKSITEALNNLNKNNIIDIGKIFSERYREQQQFLTNFPSIKSANPIPQDKVSNNPDTIIGSDNRSIVYLGKEDYDLALKNPKKLAKKMESDDIFSSDRQGGHINGTFSTLLSSIEEYVKSSKDFAQKLNQKVLSNDSLQTFHSVRATDVAQQNIYNSYRSLSESLNQKILKNSNIPDSYRKTTRESMLVPSDFIEIINRTKSSSYLNNSADIFKSLNDKLTSLKSLNELKPILSMLEGSLSKMLRDEALILGRKEDSEIFNRAKSLKELSQIRSVSSVNENRPKNDIKESGIFERKFENDIELFLKNLNEKINKIINSTNLPNDTKSLLSVSAKNLSDDTTRYKESINIQARSQKDSEDFYSNAKLVSNIESFDSFKNLQNILATIENFLTNKNNPTTASIEIEKAELDLKSILGINSNQNTNKGTDTLAGVGQLENGQAVGVKVQKINDGVLAPDHSTITSLSPADSFCWGIPTFKNKTIIINCTNDIFIISVRSRTSRRTYYTYL